MSLSAAVIDALLEAGASRELIAAAIKADIAEREAADAARMEAKRSGNRERQRRYREAHNESNADNALRDVTGVTNCDSPAPNKSPPDPQKLTPTREESEIAPARKAGSFPCPDGVNPEHWRDFLANRKTKRLTNTPTAYRQQLKALNDLSDDEWPPGRIVEFAAARGWGAIFDPRTSAANERRPPANGLGRNQPDGLSPTTRAAERAFGIPFGAGEPRTVSQ